jgi:pimeloyl-ACP methyl ester carboxylesterase
MKPTVILVHGAFAESSSWDGVVAQLLGQGYPVIAWANPLRGVAADAEQLTALVRNIEGKVVLVGHSYGGAVISNVPADAGEVTGLVFVAGFALEPGESCADASSLVAGGTLGDTLRSVPLPGGVTDLYIAQDRYHAQFSADLPTEASATMAATQRPIAEAALSEPSGAALWKAVPSWFVFGELDHNIPAGAHQIMADRAKAQKSVEVPGASHVVGISHPDDVITMITAAAEATAG